MAVSRGSCRGRVLWRPHRPHIPCSLCHLMPSHVHPYPHGPPANVATLPAPINCTYSRTKVGRSVWLNKDYCLKSFSSSSKIFRQGGNAWNLFDFDQSAAIFCVDTIKHYSIPSIPSDLEGAKTRPHEHTHTNSEHPNAAQQ